MCEGSEVSESRGKSLVEVKTNLWEKMGPIFCVERIFMVEGYKYT